MIIDFHTHIFPERIAESTRQALQASGHITAYITPSASKLAASMQHAGIDKSVTLPVCTRPDGADKLNRSLIEETEHADAMGLITFGAIHPDTPDMKEQLRMLQSAGIKGIKLHPAFQRCALDDPRMLRIIDEASALGMIVVVHGGWDVSYPEQNLASAAMIQKVLHDIMPQKLVMAHMGGWGCWDEVERELAGAPLWFDTGFSIGQVEPWPQGDPVPNLSDEAFLRLVRKHGADKILFGTDSPWADQKNYMDHISRLPLTDAEQQAILGQNAARLLGLGT